MPRTTDKGARTQEHGRRSTAPVHLDLGERSVEGEIKVESGPDRDPREVVVAVRVESIRQHRHQIQEGAGKVRTLRQRAR